MFKNLIASQFYKKFIADPSLHTKLGVPLITNFRTNSFPYIISAFHYASPHIGGITFGYKHLQITPSTIIFGSQDFGP